MNKNIPVRLIAKCLSYMWLFIFFPVNSQVINVTTSGELLEAVNNGLGDTIQLSEGTFVLNQSLQPKAGMTIRGMGIGNTTIKGATSWNPSIDDLPKNETPSSYLINLGSGNNDITISDLSLEGPQLHGAIYGVKCYGLHLYNLHIEDFRWSSIRTFNLQHGKIHDNTFVNAGGKIGWTGGALFLNWTKDSEFWNNHITKTDKDKKFFGFKGTKATRCRFHHNTVEVNFSFEFPFYNDSYVEIDHNYFTGVISIPKFGGGSVPEGGYSFHIHHNWLTHSYAIEGSRNGAIIDHNLFDFSTDSDGGNMITNFGSEPAEGPTHFHDNLIKNPGRGIFWSKAEYNNFHFHNNHVIANQTITPRNEGLFGFNEGNDFSTVVIKDNIIECIDNPRPLMRNEASYNAVIENNELINIKDTTSFENPQTDDPKGVPLDSIDFLCGAYEQFHVSGWDVRVRDIAKDTFKVTLSAIPEDGGNVEGEGTYRKEEMIIVAAFPADGYYFEKWTENNDSISSEINHSIFIMHDVNLTAHFFKGYPLSLVSYPENAGILSGAGVYKEGSLVSVSANPIPGFKFEKWTEADTVYSYNHDTLLSIESFERSLTAHFTKVYSLNLSVNPAEAGSTEGDGTYAEGDSINISAKPNSGFVFNNWTEADTVYAFTEDTLVQITGERTIYANFNPVYTVILYAEPPEGGTVEGGGTFLNESETTLSATPKKGYAFDIWTETDTLNSLNSFFSSAADTTINVTQDKVYTARFYLVSSLPKHCDDPVAIYPNPVHETLHVNIDDHKEHVSEVIVKNYLGEKIFIKKFQEKVNRELTIHISSLKPGIYYITLVVNNNEITKKVVKL